METIMTSTKKCKFYRFWPDRPRSISVRLPCGFKCRVSWFIFCSTSYRPRRPRDRTRYGFRVRFATHQSAWRKQIKTRRMHVVSLNDECVHSVVDISAFRILKLPLMLIAYCFVSRDNRLRCDCRRLLIESLSDEYEASGTGEGSFNRLGAAIGRRECSTR